MREMCSERRNGMCDGRMNKMFDGGGNETHVTESGMGGAMRMVGRGVISH